MRKIFKKIKKMGKIKNLKDVEEYFLTMGYDLEEVNIKYQIYFKDSEEPFNFSSDADLIEWAEEDRQKSGN